MKTCRAQTPNQKKVCFLMEKNCSRCTHVGAQAPLCTYLLQLCKCMCCCPPASASPISKGRSRKHQLFPSLGSPACYLLLFDLNPEAKITIPSTSYAWWNISSLVQNLSSSTICWVLCWGREIPCFPISLCSYFTQFHSVVLGGFLQYKLHLERHWL